MIESNNSGEFPINHLGINYYDFIPELVKRRSCKTYLEIGVSTGALLERIESEIAVGIDPNFGLNVDVTNNKKTLQLHRMSSDAYFADEKNYSQINGLVDFAFLDGMHLFEFLLRDFYNTERLCHKGSLIALHDCLPLNEFMADRDFWKAAERGEGSLFPNYWTGDVWKIIPILQTYRPDLRVIYFDAAPTGLVFVSNLDPRSTILHDHYIDIVRNFKLYANDEAGIRQMYNSIEILPTEKIYNTDDQSLYFRV